jgi:hypothetical protein
VPEHSVVALLSPGRFQLQHEVRRGDELGLDARLRGRVPDGDSEMSLANTR